MVCVPAPPPHTHKDLYTTAPNQGAQLPQMAKSLKVIPDVAIWWYKGALVFLGTPPVDPGLRVRRVDGAQHSLSNLTPKPREPLLT